jgi:hypothetical protein
MLVSEQLGLEIVVFQVVICPGYRAPGYGKDEYDWQEPSHHLCQSSERCNGAGCGLSDVGNWCAKVESRGKTQRISIRG